jgi:hypothetical protein
MQVIWLLGSLRSYYLAAEGGTGRLASIAWSGGLIAATFGLMIPGADEVGALNKDHIDASGAAVLHHLSDAFFIGAEYSLPIFFFASAILVLRHAVLPRWLGWVEHPDRDRAADRPDRLGGHDLRHADLDADRKRAPLRACRAADPHRRAGNQHH